MAGANGTAGASGNAVAPGPAGAAVVALPGPAFPRRLTREEYRNTVLDVLGVDIASELRALPRDEIGETGFTTAAVNLTVELDHVKGYLELAPTVVAKMADFPAFLKTHAPCQTADGSCREGFVRSAGRLMFRRPPSTEEAAAFTRLFQQAIEHGFDFSGAARGVLQAMLQGPRFLYRLEPDRAATAGQRPLDGHEMASRLSYLLWASAPDAALYDAATRNELADSAGIARQVERMLAMTKNASRVTATFVNDWTRISKLGTVVENADRVGLTEALRAEMDQSVTATAQDHIWARKAPMMDLFTTTRAMLTPGLARTWYGFTTTPAGLQPYDLAAKPERTGLLTQPGVLTAMSAGDLGGNMVARGLYIEEELFCREPLPFPDALLAQIEAFKSAVDPRQPERVYAETRFRTPACAICHERFESLALGFERYNALGRFAVKNTAGHDLRADGWISAGNSGTGDKVPYKDLPDYMRLMRADANVGKCLTKKQLQFALGRLMGASDHAALEQIHAATTAAGGTYPALVRALATSPTFFTIATSAQ